MPLPLENMPFEIAVVEFNLKAVSPIFFDNYPGFIIRSGFGAALKKLCIYTSRRMPCTQCRLQDNCPYSYIFETYRPGDRQIDFTAENFPHPFVFYPSVKEEGLLHSGSELTITLTLFGQGIAYLMFYIYAFDLLAEMGLGSSRGRYVLDSVTDIFTGDILYSHSDKTLRGQPRKKTLVDLTVPLNHQQIKLVFNHPTKIEVSNRSIDKLTPEILIRGLLRRASLLADLHLEQKWQLDFHEIIADFTNRVSDYSSNLKLERLERYSIRQKRAQPHFAFTGFFSMRGQLTPFTPLLQLGSYMQLGKGTSQGFGKYEIQYE